jgi:hypothetical protein
MTDALALESLGARARRFALPVPDALLALIYALAASIEFLPTSILAYLPTAFYALRDELQFALFVEGGFLLMQGTLVDIATRLKKRPPVWLIPIILGGVLLFSDGSREVLKLAWERGMLVFLPLLVSLLDRGYLLWHMPSRTPIQKIAARALISNRIVTGLGLCGAMLVVVIVFVVTRGSFDPGSLWPFLTAGAIYFAVAAYDEVRVRGRRFAAAPCVLFRWDAIDIKYLDPLG